MVVDSFYTSSLLASELTSYIEPNSKIYAVADFCVGGGELLRAVQFKWPNAAYFGSDISYNAINELQISHPDWVLRQFNFLDNEYRLSIIKKKRFDLVVLNPPFTCKGSTIHKIQLDGKVFRTSTAMAFVVESLKYIKKEGVVYAILPVSVAYSQKDKTIWEYLVANYNLTILEERDKQSFKNCAPSIILVAINDNKKVTTKSKRPDLTIETPVISIKRGNISMHEINKYPGEYGLIHTTNINNNQLLPPFNRVAKESSLITGPAVLIPRVCSPNANKICILPYGERYALSDCVISLCVKDNNDAKQLEQEIVNNWDNFKLLYQGTGAKYITMERLKSHIKSR